MLAGGIDVPPDSPDSATRSRGFESAVGIDLVYKIAGSPGQLPARLTHSQQSFATAGARLYVGPGFLNVGKEPVA